MSRKHRIIYRMLMPAIRLFNRIKFGYSCEKAGELPDSFIVLSNHTTDFDMLFVACSFPGRHMYFVGSEHISRWKIYPLLKWAFSPIIRRKGTVAASTVTEIMRRIRKGSNVCIFAEGVRSWDGVTQPILPSTGKLIKSARCGLVTYRLSGGYLSSPVWSEGSGTRKGYLHGRPVHIFTAEQISFMTVDQINCIINEDLYENAYDTQRERMAEYKGKNLAERLENLLFICPECSGHDCLSSAGASVTCSSCGLSFSLDRCGMLSGAPCQTVYELSLQQKKAVARDAESGAAYTSPSASISSVGTESDTLIERGTLFMDGSTLRCGSTEISLDDVPDMAIHGKHSIVFASNGAYYEVTIDDRGNAIKYILLFEAYKNIKNRKETVI